MNDLELSKHGLNHASQVDTSREIAQVQGQVVMAKKFPRNETQALINIEEACKRVSLAKLATYSYPRGGTTVSGPSIRLAETIARYYGNLDYGIREVEQRDGKSIVQAYVWDLETNLRVVREFTVAHERMARGQVSKLTDPRDIYELVANNGARRLRACILEVIPPDIVEQALITCKSTLIADAQGQDTRPLKDRVVNLVKAFKNFGVTGEMIADRLGHPLEEIDGEEFFEYVSIYNSIKDGQAKREQWFKIKRSEQSENSAASKKLGQLKEAQSKERKPESEPSLTTDDIPFD